jgi:glutamate/aspartate transport system permease protein
MMGYDFDWSSIARAAPYLMHGMGMTAFLVAIAMSIGVALGTMLAIARLFGPRWLAVASAGYVNLFRSIPLILTILWVYFLMPVVLRSVTGDPNLTVGPIYAAVSAFVLAESAYYCEIIRAGIGSVRSGQMAAGLSLGMTRWQVLRSVVLPQAFRNMTPSLINQTIALLKDTSLVYVISLSDFLGAASKIGQRDGRVVEMYIFVALVYLALCSAGVALVARLQNRRMDRAA